MKVFTGPLESTLTWKAWNDGHKLCNLKDVLSSRVACFPISVWTYTFTFHAIPRSFTKVLKACNIFLTFSLKGASKRKQKNEKKEKEKESLYETGNKDLILAYYFNMDSTK